MSKENLEHLKMINWRLFIDKFCNNSKMLLSSSWAIFIRALVFSSSPRAIFSSLETSFHSYLVYKSKNRKTIYYHKDSEVSIMFHYLFWYNKTQSRSFLIRLETTLQWLREFETTIKWLREFEQKIMCEQKV